MSFLNTVNETFYSLIDKFEFKATKVNENFVLLNSDRCIISIKQHFGEVDVRLRKLDGVTEIRPLLWAYIFKKLDYTKIISPKFSPDTNLGTIVKYHLILECSYIRLFCNELLHGDFSKEKIYLRESENVLKKINQFWEESNIPK